MFAATSWILAGFYGLIFGSLFAVVALAMLYYRSDASLMNRFAGYKVTDTSSRGYKIVARVAKNMRFALVPELYLIPVKAPNSFIIGGNHQVARLGLTEGLLETLTDPELEGVVGHELAHIQEFDSNLGGTVARVASVLWSLTPEGRNHSGYRSSQASDIEDGYQGGPLRFLPRLLIMPLIAAFIQLTMTPEREFVADRRGATFTNRFKELATALLKIQNSTERIFSDNHPHLAHLLIYSNFQGRAVSFLFSAQPSIADRVNKLNELASTGGGPS